MNKISNLYLKILSSILGLLLFTNCTGLGMIAGSNMGEFGYPDTIKTQANFMELEMGDELKVVLTNKDTLYVQFQSYEDFPKDTSIFNYQIIIDSGFEQWSLRGIEIQEIYIGGLISNHMLEGAIIGLVLDIMVIYYFSQYEYEMNFIP